MWNNSFKISYTILEVATRVRQPKRTMMAAGTQISTADIINQKKIFMKIFLHLRKGPFTQKDLLHLVNESILDVKSFQHIVTVMFPNAQFPLEMVQAKYSNVFISLDRTDNLSWGDLITTHIASYIKTKHNFPPKGKLYVQGTPPYDPVKGDTSCNAEAIANTGQKNPDYMVVDGSFGRRFFDFKSGLYSPMKGHIILKNDRNTFDSATKDLMQHHIQYFAKLGLEFTDVRIYIFKLLQDNTIDWLDKSQQLQQYYFTIMPRLSNEIPSFIFKSELLYDTNNMPHKNFDGVPVKVTSCATANDTQKVVLGYFDNSPKYVLENYRGSHGVDESPLSPIYNKLRTKFITEILEMF